MGLLSLPGGSSGPGEWGGRVEEGAIRNSLPPRATLKGKKGNHLEKASFIFQGQWPEPSPYATVSIATQLPSPSTVLEGSMENAKDKMWLTFKC